MSLVRHYILLFLFHFPLWKGYFDRIKTFKVIIMKYWNWGHNIFTCLFFAISLPQHSIKKWTFIQFISLYMRETIISVFIFTQLFQCAFLELWTFIFQQQLICNENYIWDSEVNREYAFLINIKARSSQASCSKGIATKDTIYKNI